MTLVVTERLTLTTLTVAEAAAIVAGDRAGRPWVDDYPTEGDVVVAAWRVVNQVPPDARSAALQGDQLRLQPGHVEQPDAARQPADSLPR